MRCNVTEIRWSNFDGAQSVGTTMINSWYKLLIVVVLVTRCSNLFLPRRSHEDLVEFLKEDVYVDYNPRMYDVLRRNCNHFSNELAQFLLHGKQL